MANKKKTEDIVEEKNLDGVATTEEPVVEEREETPFDVFLNHQRSAVTNAGKALQSLVPTGLRDHGSKAVEEMLEGYRVLFNSAIDDVLENVRTTKDRVNEATDKTLDRVEQATTAKQSDETESV